MQTGSLINVSMSDPWDLVSEIGGGPFPAAVQRVSTDLDKALIVFDRPILSDGKQVQALIASPRYVGVKFNALASGITCGFTAADNELIANFDRLEARKLTSWFQAIGTLTPR